MSSKPSNWYQMTYDEQRAWERANREREDLEYNLDQAREEAERAAARHRRELSARREAEARALRGEHDAWVALECAQRARDQAYAFIKARGLWKDFLDATPNVIDDDDEA